jgi:SAM-dependent methyltransferase
VAVLDLACGTGTLSAKLANVAAEVVGLDASESMLAVARSRADCPGVDFILGDMREFDIARRFDFAVCASNAMNYVADGTELEQVLAAVARHLRPGGVFVFDAVTDHGMRLDAGHWIHMDLGERKLAMRSDYDPAARREKTLVVLANGIEIHQRSPIDRADVVYAAFGAGLAVVEQFSATSPSGSSEPGWLGFHVLEKKGTG